MVARATVIVVDKMSRHPEDLGEEFDNFLYKVNEVSNIVEKLASNDRNLQELGNIEARNYLGESCPKSDFQEDNLEVRVKTDRTVINKKALMREDNPETKSQEVFMDEIAKDADKRYKDKLRRLERMETLKKQGNLAFKRGEFEKAQVLYSKAIEQIKDSCLLYLNRALTNINLKLYDRAIDDVTWALRLNENSLKGWLLSAKAHYFLENYEDFENSIKEAKARNRNKIDFIEGYVAELKSL